MAIIDVIKYEGGNNVLVWKHPKEDFNTSAQLIVHESQEAVVFKDGQVLPTYTAGKYTIETENIPVIRRLVGLVTDGISPNHYEVYFINKAYVMDVYWGTAPAWTIQDPSLQVPFEMQAHGQFAIRVVDSKQLLLKLVGTTSSFTSKALQDYFYGIMISRIKDYISNLIIEEGLSHTEINSRLIDISEKVMPKLATHFTKYGLALEEFVVENISILKDEVYDSVRDAMKIRAANTITGVTEQEKMGYDVAKAQAQNPGTGGQYGQIATGIAAGVAMAPTMGNIARNVMQPVHSSGQDNIRHRDQFSMGVVRKGGLEEKEQGIKCVKCGTVLDADSRFCSRCGTPTAAQKVQDITCPVCGAILAKDSKFCNLCGTEL